MKIRAKYNLRRPFLNQIGLAINRNLATFLLAWSEKLTIPEFFVCSPPALLPPGVRVGSHPRPAFESTELKRFYTK